MKRLTKQVSRKAIVSAATASVLFSAIPLAAPTKAFGSGGRVLPSFGQATAGIIAATLDSEGRLVAAGNVIIRANTTSLAVARYLTQ